MKQQSLNDVEPLISSVFAEATRKTYTWLSEAEIEDHTPSWLNQSENQILTHPVLQCLSFGNRDDALYEKAGEQDLSLNRTMIPLGSCTMKLNAAAEMFAFSWPEFGGNPSICASGSGSRLSEIIKNLKMACARLPVSGSFTAAQFGRSRRICWTAGNSQYHIEYGAKDTGISA